MKKVSLISQTVFFISRCIFILVTIYDLNDKSFHDGEILDRYLDESNASIRIANTLHDTTKKHIGQRDHLFLQEHFLFTEHLQKSFWWDLYTTGFLHTFFTLFLLFQKFSFTCDVTTI